MVAEHVQTRWTLVGKRKEGTIARAVLIACAAIATTLNAEAVCTRTIAGRQVYYNNCFFDGNSPGFVSAAQENGAIAPDKSVLLPGQTATLANLHGYTRGVNGLIIDVAGSGCPPLPSGPMSAGGIRGHLS